MRRRSALDRLQLPAAGAAVLLATAAGAQPAGDQPDPAQPAPSEPPARADRAPSDYGFSATDYSLRARASYEDHADLHGGGRGDVSIFRAGLEFNAAMPVNARTRIRVGADSEYSNWNFKGPSRLTPSGQDPVEELSAHGLGLGVEQAFGEGWSWVARGKVRDGLEGEAKAIDGLSWDVGGGLMYEFKPGIKLGLGAAVYQRVEDDVRVLPIPLAEVEVRLTDHLTFDAGIPRGANLRYHPTHDFALNVGVSFRYQDYRLSSDNPVPEGVFREIAVPLLVQADWTFVPAWTLQAGIGMNLYQRLDVDDRNGHDVANARTERAPTLFLGLRWDF